MRGKISGKIGNLDGLESPGDITRIIDDLMRQSKTYTVSNAHGEVEKVVPKDEGDLRNSIHNALDTSRYDGTRVTINFRSNLWYASDVDAYETSQVQHAIDPQAVGHFSKALAKFIKFRWKINWDIAKRMIGA